MLTIEAPAKINWFLRILRKREDGCHDIVSLMQRITLCDTLTLEHSDRIEVITDANIPLADNLVYKAAVLLKERAGADSGARIKLKKEIPLAAGLGGGSSDAAATLTGLNRLWDLGMTAEGLADIGASLGSDVPFFLSSPAALVEGRGERVSPWRPGSSRILVLVKPSIGVSTAWAYARAGESLGEKSSPGSSGILTKEGDNIKLFCRALDEGDFPLLRSLRRNDLEPPVLCRYPVVGEIRERLERAGALFSSMSGSGPTVFGVFRTEEEAFEAGKNLFPYWHRIVRTVTD